MGQYGWEPLKMALLGLMSKQIDLNKFRPKLIRLEWCNMTDEEKKVAAAKKKENATSTFRNSTTKAIADLKAKNKLINNLPNCVFKELHVNIGRSAIRNLLGKDPTTFAHDVYLCSQFPRGLYIPVNFCRMELLTCSNIRD